MIIIKLMFKCIFLSSLICVVVWHDMAEGRKGEQTAQAPLFISH